VDAVPMAYHCFSLSKVYYINYISSIVADYFSDPKPCEANLQQPTIQADLETQCKEVKIKSCLMIHDVSTCWNSTALMLECLLELQEALKLLVVMEEHNKPCGVRLS
jgi:hypothetical protein